MARWRCGGRKGCGTVYRLQLSRCPRCHSTRFEEESMAKITVNGGPSNAHAAPGETGYMAPPEAPEAVPAIEETPVAEAALVVVGEPAPEPVDLAVPGESAPVAKATVLDTANGGRSSKGGNTL